MSVLSDPAQLGALALYCLVTSITPGPNNLMLAAAGMQAGFRGALPAILGVATGFAALLALTAAGVGALIAAEPALHHGLKAFGSLYLVWLAAKLWRAAAPGAAAGPPMGFRGAVGLQFVNPKAWVMAVGAIAAFTTPGADYAASALVVGATFWLVGSPANASWAAFGAALRRVLADDRRRRLANRGLALATLACVPMILL